MGHYRYGNWMDGGAHSALIGGLGFLGCILSLTIYPRHMFYSTYLGSLEREQTRQAYLLGSTGRANMGHERAQRCDVVYERRHGKHKVLYL